MKDNKRNLEELITKLKLEQQKIDKRAKNAARQVAKLKQKRKNIIEKDTHIDERPLGNSYDNKGDNLSSYEENIINKDDKNTEDYPKKKQGLFSRFFKNKKKDVPKEEDLKEEDLKEEDLKEEDLKEECLDEDALEGVKDNYKKSLEDRLKERTLSRKKRKEKKVYENNLTDDIEAIGSEDINVDEKYSDNKESKDIPYDERVDNSASYSKKETEGKKNNKNIPQDEKSPTFWERRALEKVLLENIKEQRAKRRWGIFFKLIFIAIIGAYLYIIFGVSNNKESSNGSNVLEVPKGKKYIATININGAIMANSRDTNSKVIVKQIESASKSINNAGIFINANSPGGSPVQSSYIYQAIMDYREKYPERKVYAVIHDICASGCYYIVSSAEKIYADKSSIVGSIGVISQSYGIEDTLSKIGLENRTFKAGEHKDFLNPARPILYDERIFMETILKKLHKNFIDAVKAGRGDRLDESVGNLFSGLFWTGSDAVSLGLIDGIDTPTGVKKMFGNYSFPEPKKNPFNAIFDELGLSTERITESAIREVFEEVKKEKMQQQYNFN